jgi:arsenate reductase
MYGLRNCDTVKKARAWLEKHGTFRKLDDPEKENLNQQKALMLAQPSMIRRPVVELGERLVVGFKPELYKTIKWR